MNNSVLARSARRVAAAVGTILLSLLVCAALLLCVDASHALEGISALLLSGLSSLESLNRVFLYWQLLLFTGLSVAVGLQAGFFNTGAPGQFTVGALLALMGAMLFSLPWWACLPLAMIGGALWGAIAGTLKTKFHVHEVLSTVMLNAIALHLTQWIWTDALEGREGAFSANAALPVISGGTGIAFSVGLVIALLFCLAYWVLLRFHVWGYELRAGTSNPNCAKRAGMLVSRNLFISACVSGGLAGLGGACCFLSGMTDTALAEMSALIGFAGIPTALLSCSHPLGTIITAFFSANILAGRGSLPTAYPGETGLVLLGFITLFGAIFQNNRRPGKR